MGSIMHRKFVTISDPVVWNKTKCLGCPLDTEEDIVGWFPISFLNKAVAFLFFSVFVAF